jgi:hypothetical protein
LLFNINLKQNDGLLANAVAASFETSYVDACRMIDEFSDECRFILKTEKPCIFPQIGKLYPGKEGIIHFEQEQDANLLSDAFGLISFISPPIMRNSSSFKYSWNHSNRRIQQTGKKFILPRALKWAAVIALPIGVAAVIGVTQYDKLSTNFANKAGILGSVYTRFAKAPAVNKRVVPVIPVSGVKTADKIVVTPAPVEVAKPAIGQNDQYAVIVGAFKMKENAEKLITELQQKGLEASIFDQSRTGLFRVTIGTCSDQSESSQLLALAKSNDIIGAWILEK